MASPGSRPRPTAPTRSPLSSDGDGSPGRAIVGWHAEPLARVRALDLKPGFAMCELGDQYVLSVDPKELGLTWFPREWGCARYVSIDGNGRATHTADLNKPLAVALGQFDLVTDIGCGEHVFDQAQVWRTLHDLTRVGGWLVIDRPVQGYPGHGFFNADESVYPDVAAANHYDLHYLSRRTTTRGELVTAILRRTRPGDFVIPNQGRYRKILGPIR